MENSLNAQKKKWFTIFSNIQCWDIWTCDKSIHISYLKFDQCNQLVESYLTRSFLPIAVHMVIDAVPVDIFIIHVILFIMVPLVTLAWFLSKIYLISYCILFVGIPFPPGVFCLVKQISLLLNVEIFQISLSVAKPWLSCCLLAQGVRLHVDSDFCRGFWG